MMEINRTNDQHSKSNNNNNNNNNNSHNTHRITEQRTISAKQTRCDKLPLPQKQQHTYIHTYRHAQAHDTSWETDRYPVNRPDPVRIGREALARSGPDESCTPALLPDRIRLGQNVTQSARTKSDRIRWAKTLTQSARTKSDPGLVLHDIIRDVCGRTEPSLKVGKLVAGRLRPARNRARWFLHTGLLPDQTLLAKPWPGHPDRTRVGFAQYDPYLLWKNGTETDAGSRIRQIRSGPILAARWP